MNRTLLALSLVLLSATSTAQQPATTGLPPIPANRIVGLWQVSVTVSPCAGGPARSFIAYSTYHAGGTLSDTNATPPNTRGPGHGVWQYQGGSQYTSRFQFFRYLPDGSYDGVSDIRTETTLGADGMEYSTEVRARLLNPDGSLRADLCGIGVAQRVSVD